MVKHNASCDLATIEDGERGKVLLVFYADRNDIGDHEKASFILEFDNWDAFSLFIRMQNAIVAKIDPVMRAKAKGH